MHDFPQTQSTAVAAAPPADGGKRLLARLLGVCCWIYLAGAIGLWSLLAAADWWWPATFFLFCPRWTALLPLAGLLPAALWLRRRSLLPVLLGLLLVLGPVMGFCIPWQRLASSPPPGTQVRILTCNMHYYKASTERLEHLVAQTRPDVILLQEWRGSALSRAFLKPPWLIHDMRGLFLASPYPLYRATPLGDASSGEHGLIMRYELDAPVGRMTVFNVHLASPRDGLAQVVHERGAAVEELETASQLRWQQSERLAYLAQQISGPLLLAGDFNTPPESAIFRSLWDRYTNAFSVAGWGWGYTFKGNRTLVRIDHILAGPGWHCAGCWVGPNVGSPHRPVIADLTWTGR